MPSIHPLTVSSTEIEATCRPFMAALAVPLPWPHLQTFEFGDCFVELVN
jgi:hypothetical protein